MRFGLLLASVALLACAYDAIEPGSTELAQDEIELAPGEETRVDGILGVAFSQVLADSRCAIDVVCVWPGDATVEVGLRLGMGPTHRFELNLLSGMQSATFGDYEVTFLALRPSRRSDREIDRSQYRAVFRVRHRQS